MNLFSGIEKTIERGFRKWIVNAAAKLGIGPMKILLAADERR